MPSTVEKIAPNVYKFPGENTHLGLQRGEVAFYEKPKRSGWILVAIGAVAVVLALVAMGNIHGG